MSYNLFLSKKLHSPYIVMPYIVMSLHSYAIWRLGTNYHKIAKYLQEVSFAIKVGFIAFTGPIYANRVAECSIHIKYQLYWKRLLPEHAVPPW